MTVPNFDAAISSAFSRRAWVELPRTWQCHNGGGTDVDRNGSCATYKVFPGISSGVAIAWWAALCRLRRMAIAGRLELSACISRDGDHHLATYRGAALAALPQARQQLFAAATATYPQSTSNSTNCL